MGRHFSVSGCSFWQKFQCTHISGILDSDCIEGFLLCSVAFLCFEAFHSPHHGLSAGILLALYRACRNRSTSLQIVSSVWYFATAVVSPLFHRFPSLLDGSVDAWLLSFRFLSLASVMRNLYFFGLASSFWLFINSCWMEKLAGEKCLDVLSCVILRCLYGETFQLLMEVGEDFCSGIVFGMVSFAACGFFEVVFGEFGAKTCQHVIQGLLRGDCKRLVKFNCFLPEKTPKVLELRFLSQSVSHWF